MASKKPKIESLSVSELIGVLREDLIKSYNEDEKKIFRIREATVEVEAIVSKKVAAGGKVNIYLTSVGAEATEASGSRCKMAITLESLGDSDVMLRGTEEE